MELTPYPDLVPNFVDEYTALVARLGRKSNDKDLANLLRKESDWTKRGSAVLIMLARKYGTFVLANALALAEALDIEDGSAGI
jgi:hypothetical protein